MRIADVMTTKIFSLRVDKKLFIAQQIMDWAHIRHVPVVDGHGHLVGLVSHRDLLRASISSVASEVANIERNQHLSGIAVRDVMQTHVQTVSTDASVREAARLMLKEKIGCLPVVNAENKLLGIVTEYDLLKLIEQQPE